MTLAAELAAVCARLPEPVPGETIDELRTVLEEELTDLTASLDPAVGPLRLPKRRLADVLACERYVVANLHERPLTLPVVAGSLLHRVAAHVVLTGQMPADPLTTARHALDADDEHRLRTWLDERDPHELAVLAANLMGHTEELVARLGDLDSGWWPRLESPVAIVFAGGRVVASASFDLVLGGGATCRPGVVVELKTGPNRDEHRQDLFWYALLAALRDGRAPQAVATLAVGGGDLIVEPVGPGTLRSAAYRALDATERLVRLASGEPPPMRPGPRCRWCAACDRCQPGTAWITAAEADPYGLGLEGDGAEPGIDDTGDLW